jgi:hypothetical protein
LYVKKKEKVKAMRDFQKAIEIASRQRVIKDGQNLLPAKAASQYSRPRTDPGSVRGLTLLNFY